MGAGRWEAPGELRGGGADPSTTGRFFVGGAAVWVSVGKGLREVARGPFGFDDGGCVFDADGEAIGAPVTLFRGLMDSDSVKDSGGEVSVTISLESAMSDQLRPRIFRYDHEDQQTRYPDEGDKGLEFVAAQETQTEAAACLLIVQHYESCAPAESANFIYGLRKTGN